MLLKHKELLVPLDCIRSSLGLSALTAIAVVLASKTTYLLHEQGGQGLIGGTNVLDYGVCSCLGPGQALFISTSVGSHTHTPHAML